MYLKILGSRGIVGRVEDQKSRGLGFDSRHIYSAFLSLTVLICMYWFNKVVVMCSHFS